MMESRERDKYLVEKEQIGAVITEALGIEKQEHQPSVSYYRETRAVVEIIAAEVVRLACWGMWFLSPEDIENAAHQMGKLLTSEQVSEVRRLFRKAFECNNENWTEMLGDAIEEVCDNG